MADPDDTYSEAETVARREAALKRMLSTPHVANPKRELSGSGAKRGRSPKPQSEMKVGRAGRQKKRERLTSGTNSAAICACAVVVKWMPSKEKYSAGKTGSKTMSLMPRSRNRRSIAAI